MSIAQKLIEGVDWCRQKCPICGRINDMVIQGAREVGDGDKKKNMIYPDMGYSFCNCHNIFYTSHVNCYNPIKQLEESLRELDFANEYVIHMPDPFFVQWDDPYAFKHWNPRKNFVIWDIDSLCEALKGIGYDIVGRVRNLGVDTPYPQTSTIIVGIPEGIRAATVAAQKHFGDSPIVALEVGSHNGRHAKLLLEHLPNISKLYLVDFWQAYKDYPVKELQQQDYEMIKATFFNNSKVKIIRSDSVEASKNFVDGTVDFIYIDADHTYEGVKRDILAWRSKVKEGGMICGHDYGYPDTPGVKQAVDEIFKDKVHYGKNSNTINDWWVYE